MFSLAGAFVPLATPFTDDGSGISEVRLARLMKRCQDAGVAGFVVCTDCGEFTTLSLVERKAMLELVIRLSQGALPVLVNVSTLNTSASLDLAQHASRHGARGVLLMPPYYYRCEPREVEGHFKTVQRYSEMPLLAIDPSGLLSPDMVEHLPSAGRFGVASAFGTLPVRTDCFQSGEVNAHPAYNFALAIPPEMESLLAKYHPAKVVKGIAEEIDLELGPVRQPLLGLSSEALHYANG